MNRLAQLRQARTEALKTLRTLHDATITKKKGTDGAEKNEFRGLTAEEQTQYEGAKRDLDQVNDEIGVEEREIELKREEARARFGRDAQRRDIDPTKEFRSFGEQMRAVYDACMHNKVDARLQEARAASGLSETVNSDGGFLVQPEFSTELIKKTYEFGQITNKVRKISINSNRLVMNTVIDEQSRANGSRWGGLQAYWDNEADTMTSSKPKFRKMDLPLKRLTGLCYATDELLQDSAALESIMTQGFAEEFSFKIEDAIINGAGAGQPLGILNAGSLVTVNKETGQASATVQIENIVKMWARLWGRSQQNAVWLINQDTLPQLMTMVLAVGTGGVPVWLPANSAAGQPYATLMGRPVIPVEYCATLGTVGDIILGDFSQYMLVDKGGAVQSAVSVHVRFINDEITYRFVYRADGQPLWNTALTPYKGSNTLSPFVALQTR